MKKFNPDEEFDKVKNKKKSSNSSKLSNVFVPVLVVACSCMALVGVTFSTKLADDSQNEFTVRVEILGNGENQTYTKQVTQGAFRDTIQTNSSFGSINCTKGNLTYDALTSTISSVYVNSDVSCVISFMDDGTKNLALENLGAIADNTGTSYYYRIDAQNNYIKINDLMFRIIRINGDGSIRLMLNDVILASNYGNTNVYEESNVKNTLDNWYITNIEGLPYLVEEDFDNNNYEPYTTDSLIDFYGMYNGMVGTLSVREVALMSDGVESKYNFLNTANGFYLMNANGASDVYYYKDGKVQVTNPDTVLSLRPVINIADVDLIGQGTVDNPYIIEE